MQLKVIYKVPEPKKKDQTKLKWCGVRLEPYHIYEHWTCFKWWKHTIREEKNIKTQHGKEKDEEWT